eukprot:CAMPEP_0172547004 /NCGR_PEP_ID=MMETSP1067-20121228/16653_1 /TAXON_ID=265564 ORGANISM="Thalassiosira punctigera, Strain Tpunct2005C2" /NCGR_SAMPLE_ID=MMETSP1067 /ASSEMBLY_ACC=CAM_ASM_000444 /LENGTH=314 /DNA_ID=CAMNT_0013334019 /DNA_START=32 /DNA_END=976 /DNA_ORIENTATION=+
MARTTSAAAGTPSFILATFCSVHLLLAGGAYAFGAYTEATLRRLAQASSLSYLDVERMSSSPYYESCEMEPVAQVVDAESESGATVFRTKSKGGGNGNGDEEAEGTREAVVVACRGSANPKNFGTNLKFNLVPATRLSQNYLPENALVHEGFQTASVGLWRELSSPLEELVTASNCDVVFTGHSLGAATALLCATHYNASYENRAPSPSVVTFGGPRLCNSVLARHLRNEALGGCDILHLVHSKDPVLANNRKLWDELGFEDVGIELECDPNQPVVFGAGGEEPQKKSPFGNFAWNIVDHCKYMGVFVGPRAFF